MRATAILRLTRHLDVGSGRVIWFANLPDTISHAVGRRGCSHPLPQATSHGLQYGMHGSEDRRAQPTARSFFTSRPLPSAGSKGESSESLRPKGGSAASAPQEKGDPAGHSAESGGESKKKSGRSDADKDYLSPAFNVEPYRRLAQLHVSIACMLRITMAMVMRNR
jgi:hypothetical protein